jgi:FkbH-like protein
METPEASLCLKLARCYQRANDGAQSLAWALRAADAGEDFGTWQAVATLVRELPASPIARRARVGVVASYTTTQFVPLLRLAGLLAGVELDIYESAYGQYRQELLDPASALHRFAPDFVVIAVHEGDLGLTDFSSTPQEDVAEELVRWTSLWAANSRWGEGHTVQHNFALPPDEPMGHLAARLPGARSTMMQVLNTRLGEEAGNAVSIVDCERLSALHGKLRWFDPRYWHISKQAVALDALPLLAKHTVGVIGARLGLTRKCLVLDLDNTLWGGVIGEDGLAGIKLGSDASGEAFVAFQEYILRLKNRGVILAVCSKNNEADAREPFEKHPEMRIKLTDIAAFSASWNPKPDSVRSLAGQLNIGLDSLVFVDDNPAERQAMREFAPEVAVVNLPSEPAHYVRALSAYTGFEAASFTAEDAQRTEQYRARAEIAKLESEATCLEDFHRSLNMRAVVSPFTAFDLPRLAQLLAKTNQFNLTTRRHSLADLERYVASPECVHFSLRLRDRFTDHGLVSLLIAFRRGDVMDIDSWLMSCRVIGRTVEREMLAQLSQRALAMGCSGLRGTYIPTEKNAMVAEVFARFGFVQESQNQGETVWAYDLTAQPPIENGFIALHNANQGVCAVEAAPQKGTGLS